MSKEQVFNFTLKDDYAFKRLLGVEENKEILQNFLECVLDLKSEEIAGLELLDKELKKEHIEEKTAILDIQVRLKSGTLIDVEIQRYWNRLFPERSFGYLAKMYGSNLKAGMPFLHTNKCVGINIIEKGFNLTDKVHSRSLFILENTNIILTDVITMHFLNLERVKDFPITSGKTKEEQLINWMKMIYTSKKEERHMLARTSPIFKLLNEKIEEITRSPEEQRLFDARMKMRSDILGEMELNYQKGIEKGIEKGREEGSYNARLETARNLISLGLSKISICKATGLSEDEIQNL